MTVHVDTAAALRAAADFVEQHPHLPVPYVTTSSDGTAGLAWYLHLSHHGLDIADQHAAAIAIFDAVGGTWEQRAERDVDDLPITTSQRTEAPRLRYTVCTRRLELAEVSL